MPAKARHRQPIINAAVRLFRQQGYAATGLNDIVEASGAPKGSLYYYFPEGKVSIAVAAVEEAGRRVAKTLEDLAATAPDASSLIKAHARLLGGWMAKSGYRDGCPITTVLLELAPAERDVAAAGRAAYAARQEVLKNKLVQDGHRERRAEELAQLCTSATQGALIQARVERSRRPIDAAANEMARLFEAELAG